MLRKNFSQMVSVPYEFVGAAGCRYRSKELIPERPFLGRVWLAMSELSFPYLLCHLPYRLIMVFRSGQDQFILKDVPKGTFSNFNEKIWLRLRENHNKAEM